MQKNSAYWSMVEKHFILFANALYKARKVANRYNIDQKNL